MNLLKTVFDFSAIKTLLDRPDFSVIYDCMHGVNGPYAKKVLVDELGQPESYLMNAVPTLDFNGGHADPNLTYAKELVAIMGLDRKGNTIDTGDRAVPSFGAAADGDGDRNMILGSKFFVSPSDSLAVIAAYADVIPFFKSQGGLKGVARSMPTRILEPVRTCAYYLLPLLDTGRTVFASSVSVYIAPQPAVQAPKFICLRLTSLPRCLPPSETRTVCNNSFGVTESGLGFPRS